VSKFKHVHSYTKFIKESRKELSDFEVKLSFGMHLGWAIEGAIGSDFKIEASYLSPNVNIAARLKSACYQYGVPFIFSKSI
jgi:class 3 adenylate cyclase